MKVFVINLDSNQERLASFSQQLGKLGVAYERFPAVDGRRLSKESRRRAFSAFRWWCAIGRPVVSAEIGCALSHLGVYRRMIEENIGLACVFEDDVILEPFLAEQLERVGRFVDPQRAQVVLLTNYTRETCSTPEIRPAKRDTSTEGYVLTQVAARRLLAANFPVRTPSDAWGRWVKMRRIELFHAYPSPCQRTQFLFGSGTMLGRQPPLSERSLLYVAFHKGLRVIGRSLDLVLRLFDKKRGGE